MKDLLQRWLNRRPPCPGVVAWGLCFPDQAIHTCSFAGEDSAVALDAVWAELAETLRMVPPADADTSRMRWVFSQHLLYAACRPDGACLGVLAELNLDEPARACIERTLSDFRALRAPAPPR
jgi:hypothetical protein